MKLLLPGGGGAGGIIRGWRLRGQGAKIFFLPGGGGAGGIIRGWGESGVEVAGCKTIFPIGHFFFIFNLKILPI